MISAHTGCSCLNENIREHSAKTRENSIELDAVDSVPAYEFVYSGVCRRKGHLEDLISQLFRLHDLDSDGYLEESELVSLNQAIAYLHYGSSADLDAIERRFSHLFRTKLNAEGLPVPYAIFNGYILQVLADLDKNLDAQEMIMEQWVAEATSGLFVYLQNPSFGSGAPRSRRSSSSWGDIVTES